MQNSNSSNNTPCTCYEFLDRSNLIMRAYSEILRSEYKKAFLVGIELLVIARGIKSASDPELSGAIDMASVGTGIPKDALRLYAEMAVALNKPVHI